MNDVLTEKQKRFCDYYLETGNATEAAIKAGYSKKYANTNANKLLQNTTIKPYIKQRLKQMDEERIAKPEEVLKYFTSVMRGEIKDQFDLDAPLQERTKAATELAKRYRLYDAKEINDIEKTKAELQIEELRLKNQKLEAEIKKLTGEDLEIEDTEELENEIYGNNKEENNTL